MGGGWRSKNIDQIDTTKQIWPYSVKVKPYTLLLNSRNFNELATLPDKKDTNHNQAQKVQSMIKSR